MMNVLMDQRKHYLLHGPEQPLGWSVASLGLQGDAICDSLLAFTGFTQLILVQILSKVRNTKKIWLNFPVQVVECTSLEPVLITEMPLYLCPWKIYALKPATVFIWFVVTKAGALVFSVAALRDGADWDMLGFGSRVLRIGLVPFPHEFPCSQAGLAQEAGCCEASPPLTSGLPASPCLSVLL